MRGITLQRLQAFTSVYETGSINLAAERLQISQPTLSRHIRDFEQGIGITLFILERGRIKPTRAAHTLYEECASFNIGLKLVSRKLEQLRQGEGDILSVGMVELFCGPAFYGAIKDLMAEFPKLKLRTLAVQSSLQLKALEEGRIDIGIVAGDVADDDLKRVKLASAHMVMLLPEELGTQFVDEMPIAEIAQVKPLIGMSSLGPIGKLVNETLEAHGVAVDDQNVVLTLDMFADMASTLRQATIVDSFTAAKITKPGLRQLPLSPMVEFDIWAISRHALPPKGPAGRLVANIKKRIKAETSAK